jgi:CheY-like chemotaxis protein
MASHGAEALVMLKKADYDAVFTDCVMPIMGGVELIQTIRRLESFGAQRAYLVALTASAGDQQHQRCMHAGADEVYVKPINALQISGIMQRALAAMPNREASNDAVANLSEADRRALSAPLQEMLDADMACIRQALARNHNTAAINASHRISGATRWLQLTDIADAASLLEEELACHRCTDIPLRSLEAALAAFARRQRDAS